MGCGTPCGPFPHTLAKWDQSAQGGPHQSSPRACARAVPPAPGRTDAGCVVPTALHVTAFHRGPTVPTVSCMWESPAHWPEDPSTSVLPCNFKSSGRPAREGQRERRQPRGRGSPPVLTSDRLSQTQPSRKKDALVPSRPSKAATS